MAMIMIKCPSTGKAVPTGMGTDRESFESSSYSGNSVQCPHCNQMHTWSKADAYLEPETPFGSP